MDAASTLQVAGGGGLSFHAGAEAAPLGGHKRPAPPRGTRWGGVRAWPQTRLGFWAGSGAGGLDRPRRPAAAAGRFTPYGFASGARRRFQHIVLFSKKLLCATHTSSCRSLLFSATVVIILNSQLYWGQSFFAWHPWFFYQQESLKRQIK